MTLQPVLYIPHGGGPLPLLGDPSHSHLTAFLKKLGNGMERPAAILMVSAHWEEDIPSVTSGAHPGLIYDYHGFPEASYRIEYPAPGSPHLSEIVFQLLAEADIQSIKNPHRGFDHGMFVPLKLIFPDAGVPCIQLSILRHLDPQAHIKLGVAISSLREEGVLIVGSGMSFHNMRALLGPSAPHLSADFDQWLVDTCTNPALTAEVREDRLIAWENAPQARYCHPREEHLLPLHVCFGASQSRSPLAEVIHHEEMMGNMLLGLKWK